MVGRPLLILSTMALGVVAATTTQAAEFGTREEAKAMLDKAVTAVKENKEKALAMFNNGESGFKDRDLYGCVQMLLTALLQRRHRAMDNTSRISHRVRR